MIRKLVTRIHGADKLDLAPELKLSPIQVKIMEVETMPLIMVYVDDVHLLGDNMNTIKENI
jgi:hypothetical protein